MYSRNKISHRRQMSDFYECSSNSLSPSPPLSLKNPKLLIGTVSQYIKNNVSSSEIHFPLPHLESILNISLNS